jgi:hypothetical protein
LVIVCCAVGGYLVLRRSPTSMRRCVYTEDGIAGVQAFGRLVHDPDISCAEMFNESASTWQQWSHPFSTTTAPANMNWPAWIRANPTRQLIVSQSLIPTDVEHENWLTPGSRGAYAPYAAALARNLVSVGLGHAIIRLAPEANGTWETYSIPTDPAGLAQWREFWRRTVEAMRSVHGAHFVFDWTVNALVRPVALRSFYPGDDVVDIIGIDAYDPVTIPGGWSRLATGTDGVRAVAQFARRHGKRFSVPEWGVVPNSSSVGQAYLRGMAKILRHTDTAYECYFYAHQFESALTTDTELKHLFEQGFSDASHR